VKDSPVTDLEEEQPRVVFTPECAETLGQVASRRRAINRSHKLPAPRQLYLGHWRRFCGRWWKETLKWIAWGWTLDLYRFLHRGRYGWAPHDSFELSDYLNGVMGGLLIELAEEKCGAPYAYPNLNPVDEPDHYGELPTDFDLWHADLARWGNVFLDAAKGLSIDAFDDDGEAYFAAENEQHEAVKRALVEMTPWWGALWS